MNHWTLPLPNLGAISVWRRNVRVWRKLIKVSLVMNFGEPLIYLLGFGYGLGRFIGDMAAMPAYCRHQGYSPKRSMLLVWENGSPNLVYEIQKGEAPEIPVSF